MSVKNFGDTGERRTGHKSHLVNNNSAHVCILLHVRMFWIFLRASAFWCRNSKNMSPKKSNIDNMYLKNDLHISTVGESKI